MVEFVICDDESDVVKKVENVIKDTMTFKNYPYEVKVFNDYDDSFKNYVSTNKKTIVYFLSAELYSDLGINAGKLIRNTDKFSIIIFLNSYTSNIESIYKSILNVLTVVSKNDRYKKNLVSAINESISYVLPSNDIVTFSDMGNDFIIPAMDILYIRKDGRKAIIKTNTSVYDVYLSLDKFKKILPSYFKQSHRACLINMKRVNKINIIKKEIHFDIGETIDYLGDKYKNEFKVKV